MMVYRIIIDLSPLRIHWVRKYVGTGKKSTYLRELLIYGNRFAKWVDSPANTAR